MGIEIFQLLKQNLFWIVVANPLAYTDGYVGDWNGSSCVAIAPNWCLSAKHTDGGPGSGLNFKYQAYQVSEVIRHPLLDLQLIRFSPQVPNWHPVRSSIQTGDEFVLAGYGRIAQVDEAWHFPRMELWGTNRADFVIGSASEFGYIRFNFSPPTSPDATEHEASLAMNDSGGGIFSLGQDGKYYLEAIHISTSVADYSSYGAVNISLHLQSASDWIYDNSSGRSDWNRDGKVSLQDLFDYQSAWLSGNADFNRDGQTTAQDFFDFLDDWFRRKE